MLDALAMFWNPKAQPFAGDFAGPMVSRSHSVPELEDEPKETDEDVAEHLQEL